MTYLFYNIHHLLFNILFSEGTGVTWEVAREGEGEAWRITEGDMCDGVPVRNETEVSQGD